MSKYFQKWLSAQLSNDVVVQIGFILEVKSTSSSPSICSFSYLFFVVTKIPWSSIIPIVAIIQPLTISPSSSAVWLVQKKPSSQPRRLPAWTHSSNHPQTKKSPINFGIWRWIQSENVGIKDGILKSQTRLTTDVYGNSPRNIWRAESEAMFISVVICWRRNWDLTWLGRRLISMARGNTWGRKVEKEFLSTITHPRAQLCGRNEQKKNEKTHFLHILRSVITSESWLGERDQSFQDSPDNDGSYPSRLTFVG